LITYTLIIQKRFWKLFFRTENTVNDKNNVKTITYRCCKTFQEQHFTTYISKCFHVLDNLNTLEDRNIALETVYTILDTTLDRHTTLVRHAQIKPNRVKHVHKPT